MLTRWVWLLVCCVCGLGLHANADELRPVVHAGLPTVHGGWQPLSPDSVFGGRTDVAVDLATQSAALAHPRDWPLAAARSMGSPQADWDTSFSSAPSLTLLTVANDDDEPEFEPAVATSRKLTFRNDIWGFPAEVWRDAVGIVRTENLVFLGGSLGVAIGIRQGLDQDVRRETAEHPERWGQGSACIGSLGEAAVQIPILATIYGVSIWTENDELHNVCHSILSSYAITGLSVLTVKGIANTKRPDNSWNGGQWGFPSWHAASSFAIAGVLEEYYGWQAGLPAYTLAGLISWSRIDQRDHDLSDVVFGAALGWVIGKSVARQHLGRDSRVILMPWSEPYTHAQGLAVETRF